VKHRRDEKPKLAPNKSHCGNLARRGAPAFEEKESFNT